MFLCGYTFSVSLGIYLGVELLGHMVTPFLTFFGGKKRFSGFHFFFFLNFYFILEYS